MSAAAPCPSCQFENPRAWRICARCGHSLSSASGRTISAAVAALESDATVVTGAPSELTGEPSAPTTAPESVEELSDSDLKEAGVDTEPEVADPEPPLIGQAEAAEVIRTAIERAFTVGSPTFVALEGGRESGKTRLLTYASEIAARVAPNVRILYGACRKGGGDGAYAPFSRLLLERFGVTPSSSPSTVRGQMATLVSDSLSTKDAIQVAETTHLLGHVAGVPFPDSPFLGPLRDRPDELRKRAARAVRRLLEGDASRRPVLLLLDDMHHVEDDGWDILSEIARADAHIAIVVAGDAPIAERAESLDTAGGVAIGPISPMEEADVAALLHVLLPTLDRAPEPLVAALTHRSEGNPGAVRELVFELIETGLFQPQGESLEVDLGKLEAGELPVTIDDAIQARLERLDEFERATLERASVVGESFWDGAILAQMRAERPRPGDDTNPTSIWPNDEDLDALHACLERLVDKGFVDREETSVLPGAVEFTFQLGGARRIVYDQLDGEVQVRRHTAVARWLSVTAELRREGIAALIAPHLEKAGMHQRAGRAYLEAAAYDRAKLRTRSALRHIERALPLIPSDDVVRRIDALHEHGSLLTTLGRYDEAIDAFTEMLRLAWSIGARGKGGAALNRIARVHRQRGDDRVARALGTRALEMFRRAGDLRGVASTLDDLAQIHRLLSETDQAVRAATEALEIRRAHGDRRGEAVSLSTLGSISISRGQLDEAEGYFGQALEIRRAIQDLEGQRQSHAGLAIVAFERGELETAAKSWRAALAQSREVADRRGECFALNNLGEAYLMLGKLDEAMEVLEESRDLAAQLGDKRALAEVERNLGSLAVRQGTDDAERTLARALELAREYGGKAAIAAAYHAIGGYRAQTLYDEGGSVDKRAEEAFLAAIDLYREIGNEKDAARVLADLGQHLVERGDLESARERLHEARAIMRSMGLRQAEKVERTLTEIG